MYSATITVICGCTDEAWPTLRAPSSRAVTKEVGEEMDRPLSVGTMVAWPAGTKFGRGPNLAQEI
jgi:hypothetical protein